jgi:hypothetical protein
MKADSNRPPGEDYPYNFIYEKLVSTPTDVVGMIAYSLQEREGRIY